MKSMKTILCCMMAAVLLAAAACAAPAASQEETQADGETLVYGSNDYTSINPALYEHGEINLLLFSGLTAHDGENNIVPALATDWSYDEETMTYTFHLREDVTWHDGEPFTAADVKFTLEAIMDPANQSEIASNYEEIASIETPDDYTVEIALSTPNVAMLDYLTVGILPAHLLEGKDLLTDSFNQNPVGTGPYKLESWDMGQSITLVKNEDYFGGEPNIDTIIFKIVEDSQVKAMQLQTGELDLAQVSPTDAEQFEGQDAYHVYDMKTADYRAIAYNFNSEFFSAHPNLPNALSYAIDRQAIVDTVLLGQGEVAYSPLQMGDYNDDSIEKFEYNPEKAKELIEADGWVLGEDGIYEKDGEKLSFTIHNGQDDQVRIDMSNICAQQLRAIGVDAKVAIDAETDWENQEAYMMGWGSPFDPDDHTYKVFGTDKGSNFTYYSNPEVDELLTQARETDVKEERQELYSQFLHAMTEHMPYTFLAYVDAIYVGDSTISGITEDTVLGHHGVGIFWNVKDWTIA